MFFCQLEIANWVSRKKKQLNTIDKGINFVGYIIKPYRKYIRKSTMQNIYNKGKIIENYRQSLNSYFGMLIHANAYRERQKIQKYYSNVKFNKQLTKVLWHIPRSYYIMNIIQIYSTPLWETAYPNFNDHKQQFLDCVTAFRASNPDGISKSNINGYQSPINLTNEANMAPLFEFVAQMS